MGSSSRSHPGFMRGKCHSPSKINCLTHNSRREHIAGGVTSGKSYLPGVTEAPRPLDTPRRQCYLKLCGKLLVTNSQFLFTGSFDSLTVPSRRFYKSASFKPINIYKGDSPWPCRLKANTELLLHPLFPKSSTHPPIWGNMGIE